MQHCNIFSAKSSLHLNIGCNGGTGAHLEDAIGGTGAHLDNVIGGAGSHLDNVIGVQAHT